ncbi:MAG: Apea-like [Thermoproteota archaeon]|nr:Apea-like [Thermoproteota archaeon]
MHSIRPKITETSIYKIIASIESGIHVKNIEYDDVQIIEKENETIFQTKAFEALDSATLEKKKAEVRTKFEAILDTLAFLNNKGAKIGNYWTPNADKILLPNGKEYIQFQPRFGRPEVMIFEEEFRQKVIPLYAIIKNDQSKFRLCLSWFNKALSENEPLNKFLIFWIALESITPNYVERNIDDSTKQYVNYAIQELKK